MDTLPGSKRMRIGNSVRPGPVGQRELEGAMPACNFVCRPAGANPARPRVSPPEPIASLAPVVETRQAMRRQTNIRAVGPRPRNLRLSGCRLDLLERIERLRCTGRLFIP
jgi:hypothetical protein